MDKQNFNGHEVLCSLQMIPVGLTQFDESAGGGGVGGGVGGVGGGGGGVGRLVENNTIWSLPRSKKHRLRFLPEGDKSNISFADSTCLTTSSQPHHVFLRNSN